MPAEARDVYLEEFAETDDELDDDDDEDKKLQREERKQVWLVTCLTDRSTSPKGSTRSSNLCGWATKYQNQRPPISPY